MIWMPKVLHIDTPDDPVVCFQQFFHARVVASLQDSVRVWCPGNHFSPGQPGWLTIVPRTHQTSWYHPEVMVNAYNLLSAVDSFVLKNLVPQMAISGMLTNILCRGSKICHENWECFCGNCGLTPTWIRRKEVEVEPSSKVWHADGPRLWYRSVDLGLVKYGLVFNVCSWFLVGHSPICASSPLFYPNIIWKLVIYMVMLIRYHFDD